MLIYLNVFMWCIVTGSLYRHDINLFYCDSCVLQTLTYMTVWREMVVYVQNTKSARLKNSAQNLLNRKTTIIIKIFAGHSSNVSNLQNERHLVVWVGYAINFPSPPCVYHQHTNCLSRIPTRCKRVGQNVVMSIHG